MVSCGGGEIIAIHDCEIEENWLSWNMVETVLDLIYSVGRILRVRVAGEKGTINHL